MLPFYTEHGLDARSVFGVIRPAKVEVFRAVVQKYALPPARSHNFSKSYPFRDAGKVALEGLAS